MRAGRCPIKGCDGLRGNPLIPLCRPHWWKLPAEMRQRVWDTATFRGVDAKLMEEAIDYLQALETDQPALALEPPCPTP